MEQKILAYYKEHEQEIFKDLDTLVLAEASTSDIEELAQVRKVLENLITERTGILPYVYETKGKHDVVRFEYGEGEDKVVIVGHYDTVHPIGSIPYIAEGNKLRGPGVYDMKSGLISAIWAVKAYQDLGIAPGNKLVFVFNGDEETGSKDSSEIIRENAAGAKAALVTEPCTATGNLKTGRKGNMKFNVTIHGKAAHAGNAHQDGINALEEMAHQILFVQSLTNYAEGTTVNVGVADGGTKVNVVPDTAVYRVDCRFKKMSERQRVIDAICGIQTTVPGATCEVEFIDGKLPMEESEGNMALFALAKECGDKLGMNFTHQFVGGGSDGNAISAMGVPTLDGLGADGDHAHSPEEYILIDQLIPRMAMFASLIPKI